MLTAVSIEAADHFYVRNGKGFENFSFRLTDAGRKPGKFFSEFVMDKVA